MLTRCAIGKVELAHALEYLLLPDRRQEASSGQVIVSQHCQCHPVYCGFEWYISVVYTSVTFEQKGLHHSCCEVIALLVASWLYC